MLQREDLLALLPPPLTGPESLAALCGGNSLHQELLEDLRRSAARYAEDVCHYHEILLHEGRGESFAAMDATRSRAHDALIASTNVLARALGPEGGWITQLGGQRRAFRHFAMALTWTAVLREDARPSPVDPHVDSLEALRLARRSARALRRGEQVELGPREQGLLLLAAEITLE